MLEIDLIKTDKGCFITDNPDRYRSSKIKDLYFDGEKPEETYVDKWFFIEKYPKKVEEKLPSERINKRYKLKNPELQSCKLPSTIPYNELDNSDERFNLYSYEYDIREGGFQKVEFEINVIFEVEDYYFLPDINYKGLKRVSFSDREISIKNTDVKHQLLDKMIIPELLLHNYPCKISSKKLYQLVRHYIKENIDEKYAKITSDYAFCFTVKKKIYKHDTFDLDYLLEDRNVKSINKADKYTVFEMTYSPKNYKGHTPIKPIHANSEKELKEKIDNYLKRVIEYINKPLIECDNCNGKGYINMKEKFDLNNR